MRLEWGGGRRVILRPEQYCVKIYLEGVGKEWKTKGMVEVGESRWRQQ